MLVVYALGPGSNSSLRQNVRALKLFLLKHLHTPPSSRPLFGLSSFSRHLDLILGVLFCLCPKGNDWGILASKFSLRRRGRGGVYGKGIEVRKIWPQPISYTLYLQIGFQRMIDRLEISLCLVLESIFQNNFLNPQCGVLRAKTIKCKFQSCVIYQHSGRD